MMDLSEREALPEPRKGVASMATRTPEQQRDAALSMLETVADYLETVGRVTDLTVRSSFGRPDPAAIEQLRGALRALHNGATRNAVTVREDVARIKGERPALLEDPLVL